MEVRVCYEISTMPNFLSLLILTIIVGVTCHPIQRRQTEDYRCRVITNVCTVLWHIQDTMVHCPAGSACNSTAMGIIHSVIRTDFSAWVRWPFDHIFADANKYLCIGFCCCVHHEIHVCWRNGNAKFTTLCTVNDAMKL